mgnify:FL=1
MDVTKNRSQHQIKNGDIILTYIGMLCMGKPYFEAVHEMDSINFELHEGKQHCQNGTIEFLQETIRFCKKLTDQPLLVHLDSGNDSIDNIAVLIDAGCYFIIKRNLRRESKDGWFDMAKQCCKNITTPRAGKTVYVGSNWKDVCSKQFKKEFTLRTRYEITERTMDKYGQILLIPEVEVETWWTNLGATDEEIIQLYHAHGECEQFHSKIKTDMDLERLPSGKFTTNALVLELGTDRLQHSSNDWSGYDRRPVTPSKTECQPPETPHCNQQSDHDGKPCHNTCTSIDNGTREKQCMASSFCRLL